MTPILLAVVVFALVFGLALAVLRMLPGARQARERSLADVAQGREPAADLLFLDLSERPDPAPWITRLLSATRLQRELQLQLIRANVVLRPSELLLIATALLGVGLVVGSLVRGVVGAILGGAALGLMPWVVLSMLRTRRKRRLMQQLPDVIDLICASLRAGFSFPQSLRTVAEQIAEPMRDEARRFLDELNIGLAQDAALQRMIVRTDQPDVALFCSAVQVQMHTGGNLGEVLGKLSAVIRERIRLRGEVDALLAEGRLSASILLGLPLAMAFALSQMSPGWLSPLVTDPLGRILLIMGITGYLLGAATIHKMIQVDI